MNSETMRWHEERAPFREQRIAAVVARRPWGPRPMRTGEPRKSPVTEGRAMGQRFAGDPFEALRERNTPVRFVAPHDLPPGKLAVHLDLGRESFEGMTRMTLVRISSALTAGERIAAACHELGHDAGFDDEDDAHVFADAFLKEAPRRTKQARRPPAAQQFAILGVTREVAAEYAAEWMTTGRPPKGLRVHPFDEDVPLPVRRSRSA